MIFMSIMYGLCNSALFPLLLTVPEEFGFKLTMNETSTFIIWSFQGKDAWLSEWENDGVNFVQLADIQYAGDGLNYRNSIASK